MIENIKLNRELVNWNHIKPIQQSGASVQPIILWRSTEHVAEALCSTRLQLGCDVSVLCAEPQG